MLVFIACAACAESVRAFDPNDSSPASDGASSSFGSSSGSGTSPATGNSGSGNAPSKSGGSNNANPSAGGNNGGGTNGANGTNNGANGGANGTGTPQTPAPGTTSPGMSIPNFRTAPSGFSSGNPPPAPSAPSPFDSMAPGAFLPGSGFPGNGPGSGTPGSPSTSPFGFGTVNPGTAPSPFSAGASGAPPTGAASSFGGGGSGAGAGGQSLAAPISYSIPGNYGQGPIRLTAGEGRLARPLFRFTGSVGVGYDDNVFQTPTRSPSSPARVVQEVVSPAIPAHTEQIQVQQNDGTVVTETIEIPTTPAKTTPVTIPAVEAQKRQGSLITKATVGWDVQFATRRTVFTFDLGGGADYYWERPGTKTDYNGNLSLAYLHKFSPRLQVTANVSAQYLTQPNLSAINTPTNNNVGPYLNLNARGDISYRWLPRFTTVTTVSYGTVYYTDSSQRGNTFDNITVGNQFSYTYSPRLSLTAEFRYSDIAYPSDSTRNSNAYYILGGADISLSRRFFVTFRAGEENRTFSDTGASKSTPYFELSGNYNLTRTTSLSANLHYGFEEPPNSTTSVRTFRGGLSLMHSFTPRISTSVALNMVNQVTTDETTNIESTQNTGEVNLGLNYTLSRKWSFGLNYTYDILFSAGVAQDYYRNRVFLTANYTF